MTYSKKYPKDHIQTAKKKLASLPAQKKSDKLTAEEIVRELKIDIENLLKGNYTHQDISKVLAESGIKISATKIKAALN